MKSRNKVELQAYQNLKTEIQKFKTAKNATPYDEILDLVKTYLNAEYQNNSDVY